MSTITTGSRSLPDFLIVGAAKSATTALFYYLGQHDRVFVPAVKEPRFFVCQQGCSDRKPPFAVAKSVCEREPYLRLFSDARQDQLKGEASTDYLYAHERAIPAIQSFYGQRAAPAMVIMLRNPVDRAWSHYNMQVREGKEPLAFQEAIRDETLQARLEAGWPMSFDYLGYGRYAGQVSAYLQAFERVHVCWFDEFQRQPDTVVNGILRFLDLDPIVELDTRVRYNVSGKPKSALHGVVARLVYRPNVLKRKLKGLIPKRIRYTIRTRLSSSLFNAHTMSEEVRCLLVDYYREDVERLENMLGRDLGFWYQS